MLDVRDNMISILIGGDLCPIGRNEQLFRDGNADAIFNDLLGEFEAADLCITNLECPLIYKETPIEKIGPVLGANVECINGIKEAGIDVVGLANNHIMDHGLTGLQSTIDACLKAGVKAVGAGENIKQAGRLQVINKRGVKIGILAMAEAEFSIATENTGGAYPLDLIDCIRNLRQNKNTYDILIVLLHAGNEYYPYPSPRLRKTCRFLVEEGANCIICQHSHCPGTYEKYRNGYIVYGQGNLAFDYTSHNQSFYHGFLVKITVNNRNDVKMHFIPHKQNCNNGRISRIEGIEKEQFIDELVSRSEAILDDNLINELWEKFCKSNQREYLSHILGLGKTLRFLNRKIGFVEKLYSKRSKMIMGNIVRCDSHRDVISTILCKGL